MGREGAHWKENFPAQPEGGVEEGCPVGTVPADGGPWWLSALKRGHRGPAMNVNPQSVWCTMLNVHLGGRCGFSQKGGC